MALFVERGAEAEDRGEPFKFARDPDTGKDVFLWIRRIPHYVAQVKDLSMLRRAADKTEADIDDDRLALEIVDRIAWAWTDTENFPVHIEDEEAAQFYEKQLSNGEVKPGDCLILDGKWNDPLKRRILTKFPDVADWILDKLGEIAERRKKEQAELAENL